MQQCEKRMRRAALHSSNNWSCGCHCWAMHYGNTIFAVYHPSQSAVSSNPAQQARPLCKSDAEQTATEASMREPVDLDGRRAAPRRAWGSPARVGSSHTSHGHQPGGTEHYYTVELLMWLPCDSPPSPSLPTCAGFIPTGRITLVLTALPSMDLDARDAGGIGRVGGRGGAGAAAAAPVQYWRD